MSWTPPERPDWVRAINEGRIPPIAEQARRPLERDALVGFALLARARGALRGASVPRVRMFDGHAVGVDVTVVGSPAGKVRREARQHGLQQRHSSGDR